MIFISLLLTQISRTSLSIIFSLRDMQSTIIEADCVDILCFWGPKQHLRKGIDLLSERSPSEHKATKAVFYVYDLSLRQYSAVVQSLRESFRQTFDQYSINILMMREKEEIKELLQQVRKMNSADFECNYVKLSGISRQRINDDLMQNYVGRKFKWNAVKSRYFLEKNGMTKVSSLI